MCTCGYLRVPVATNVASKSVHSWSKLRYCTVETRCTWSLLRQNSYLRIGSWSDKDLIWKKSETYITVLHNSNQDFCNLVLKQATKININL